MRPRLRHQAAFLLLLGLRTAALHTGGHRREEAVAGPKETTLQAAYVACGGSSCGRGLEAVKSFLAQARLDGGEKPVLHLFFDEQCARRVQELQQTQPALAAAAEIKLHGVGVGEGLTTAANLYKPCASLRLSLPRLLPGLSKVLYMDTDTYVAGSLRPLWGLQPVLWAFGENDFTWYQGGTRCPRDFKKFAPAGRSGMKCWYGESGINSGVMLLNMDAWRRLNIDEEVQHWVQKLTNGGKSPAVLKMGDQDILNLIAEAHADDGYTMLLPCEMNSLYLNRHMCFFGTGSWNSFAANGALPSAASLTRNAKQPVVVHAKFNVNNAGERCWVHLREQLREAVQRVSQGDVKASSRSLCEVAGGCDLA